MIELTKLRFKEMLKDEVIAFGPNVVKIITPFDPAALGLTPVLTRFTDQWERLSPFMQNIAGSVLTDDIIILDDRRDKDLVGIKASAKAALNHRNPAKVAAAELIINTMNSFDHNIPKLSLAVQTETVVKLVDKFENDPAVKAAMDLLGLTEWVAPLKATNQEVSDKYIGRAREAGDKPDTNFLEQRPAAEAICLLLFKMIDAKNTLDDEHKLDPLVAQLNEIISKANQTVAQRKGRGGKGVETDTSNPA